MHDVGFFEKKGVPSVALLSACFKPQAQYQATSLGLAKAHRAFVSHPISDQTKEQLEAKADAVFKHVVQALTTNNNNCADDHDAAVANASPSSPQLSAGGEECAS